MMEMGSRYPMASPWHFYNARNPRPSGDLHSPMPKGVILWLPLPVGVYPASKASVEGEAPPGLAGGGGDASPLK